jgi:hypothetical protein
MGPFTKKTCTRVVSRLRGAGKRTSTARRELLGEMESSVAGTD